MSSSRSLTRSRFAAEPGSRTAGKRRRGELVRSARVLHGNVRLAKMAPFGGARFERHGAATRVTCATRPDLHLSAWSSAGPFGEGANHVSLRAGEGVELVLRWGTPLRHAQRPAPGDALTATVDAWRRWTALVRYEGPHRSLVRRSALTLKMLDHFTNKRSWPRLPRGRTSELGLPVHLGEGRGVLGLRAAPDRIAGKPSGSLGGCSRRSRPDASGPPLPRRPLRNRCAPLRAPGRSRGSMQSRAIDQILNTQLLRRQGRRGGRASCGSLSSCEGLRRPDSWRRWSGRRSSGPVGP